ncbi:MAG TPA: phosphodiester glycosidase family protein [Armatimonadota bacterium]|nr:phosphodiester glycosidase family protein [Armatimonadota bacterium]
MLVARKIAVLLALVYMGIYAFAVPESVSLNYQVIDNFRVKYVAVNMNDPDVVVTTAVASSFPNSLESWRSFINRLHPDAAINGTYFCPHSCQPVGDVALDGFLLYRGAVGTAFCITPDNHVDMLPGPRQSKSDWHGYKTVLCAGPRLLTDGIVTINARAEGFRDPHVLGSASRSALALRGDGLLLLITIEQNISLYNLANVCKKLGAVQAMNLDGGSSSGLYVHGNTVTSPERSISNIIVVYSTRQRYSSFADRLAPRNIPVLARLLTPRPKPAPQQEPEPVYAGITFPSLATATTTPASPDFKSATSTTMITLVEPTVGAQLRGKIPVTVKIANDPHVSWCSLRINGQFRAMSNTDTLEYLWDSTKDPDGTNTLEVTVWSRDRDMIAHESHDVTIQNKSVVAEK